MVSKRNQRLLLEKRSDKREFHYGLRKLTVGVASVLLGTTVFLGGQVVHADTVSSGETQLQVDQPVTSVTDSSAAVSQVAANENQSSAAFSVVVSSAQNASQSVSRVAQSVSQGSAQASYRVDSGAENNVAQSSNAVSSAIEMSLANSSVDFGSSASTAQNFQASASDTVKPMMPQMMVMAVNDSHYQMNKVVSTGRDLWMAFDVPFVWYQPNQMGNGVLALGDGHHNGDLAPWKFQVYTQWHRDSDNGQWQFVSGYTSDPAHYALETSEVKILGSQSQNGHTFTVAALPITVNAYTLKDQLQSGGYYIMVPGLNAQAGLDQLSGSWTASIPVGANGQIPLGRLGVTVSKIQYVTGANHDQVISSVNVHQDIIRNGTAQAVNLSGIPGGYRLEYEQPSLTPVYSGYIPNDTAVNHSNCYVSINSDGTLTVNVPVVKATVYTIIVNYVDDDNGRVLYTETLKSYEAITSTYTTATELGILRNQHYVLVSDETNGKPLVFDTDNNKDQVYTIHVKHDTEEEAISSMTVNGKIFYANTPGNLAKVPSDQMPLTQNISPLSYSGDNGFGFSIIRDLVTHRWRIDQVASSIPCGLLKQVKGFWLVPVVSSSPLIDQHFWGSSWQMATTDLAGLTGSGDSGSDSVLGADIKVDLAEDTSGLMLSSLAATVTVNFHFQYMPAPESAKITYVDDTTGNTLKTEDIAADYNTYVGMDTPGGPDILRAANGYGSKIQFKTDPAAQIKLYQDQGYQLVSSNFIEGSTFKDGDGANVFTVHLGHAITPVKPSKPINSGQTTSGGSPINGAHESDLNKTVTRTIILKMPGQTDQRIVQTVKLTRSASVDEVTGKVTYGDWSTDSWPDYHVPAKVHYTADKTMIASQIVDDTTVDQTVIVSYSLNHETATLTFIDDDTRDVLATDTANGLYGSDILWNKDEADQISQFEKQGYVLVSNDFKRNPRPKFMDDLNAYTIHFTHGHQNVSHDYIVTRTINYVDANGIHLKPSTVQSLTFTRTGVQDLVTKDIAWNMTPAQSFSSVNDLYILGYKTDTTIVPVAEANWNDRNSTVDVHYQVADSTVTVNFVDATGHVVVTTPVIGQVGSTVDLAAQIPDGWVAYNTNIPTRVVIGANPTYINYLIAHRLAFVKSTDGVKAGDIIPGTKSKIFNDHTNVDNLVTHASYTVNIWADEAHTHKVATKTYYTDFIRNAAVDAITGDVYYYNWSEGGKHVFAGFTWQASDGYQAVVVPSWIATQADPTKTIDLVAQPQQLSGTIQYQTVDGKLVSTQAFTGSKVVTLTAPKGYTLMTDAATITPALERDQTYTVYIRPTQTLYTTADKLPADMESLSKTITRTIHIVEANGHVRTIKQAVHFTRTATVKADGSIEYSNWKATGRTVMNKVFLPKRYGYHIVVDGDLAKQNVTADMSDSVVNVRYVKY